MWSVGGFRSKGGGSGVTIDVDWPPLVLHVGAAAACDWISQDLARYFSERILAGMRPSGGRQRPLQDDGGSGAAAKSGRRPDIRGVTATRMFPQSVLRDRISVGAKQPTASVQVGFDGALAQFVKRDQARGVEWLTVSGDAARAIEKSLLAYLGGLDRPRAKRIEYGRGYVR